MPDLSQCMGSVDAAVKHFMHASQAVITFIFFFLPLVCYMCVLSGGGGRVNSICDKHLHGKLKK